MTPTSTLADQTEQLAPAVATLRALALAAVGDRSVAMLTDDALCTFVSMVEEAGRLVDTLRVVGAAEVDSRSDPALGTDGLAARLGCVKPGLLIEQLTRVSQGEAARRVRIGRAVARRQTLGGAPQPALRPLLAAAMASGEVGLDAAGQIIRCLADAAPSIDSDLLTAGEENLTQAARDEPTDLVSVYARAWREALNPDGTEPREEALRRRRSFVVGRDANGMTPFHGLTDPTSGALLRAMLSNGNNPNARPRFLDENLADSDGSTDQATAEEPGSGASIHRLDGEVGTDIRDPRTKEQRQHDILIGIVTAGLRETESQPSLRPLSSVVAVVTASELENGTGAGWLDGVDEPISIATVRQLACDGGIRTMVVGESGEALYLGRSRRLFSAAQRRALAVRDGGCVWPGCQAPPGWCEAHHVTEWESGGATDIDNGVLLCSTHHHGLHASMFTMKMVEGRPRLLAPPWLDADQVWKLVGRCRAMMAA